MIKQAKNKYYLRREHLNELKTEASPSPAPFKVEKEEVKKAYLPANADDANKRYTLVLDLDETLVHFISREKKFKLRPGCI